MKTRLISGTIFIIVLVLAFVLKAFASNYFFDALILGVACIASFEASKLFSKMGKYNDKYMATIFPCVLMGTLLYCISADAKIGLLYTIIISVGVMVVCFGATFVIPFLTYKKTQKEIQTRGLDNPSVAKYAIVKALNTAMTFIYPAFLLMFLTLINHFEDMPTTFPSLEGFGGNISLFVLIFAFLIPIISDTFAYLMGGLIGGKKLAPKISPKKTISGAVGGFVWCVIISVAMFFIFNAIPAMSTLLADAGITVWKVAIISGVGSIVGQCGDLFESYIKRQANVKDSGKIMPGHGGLLDRFDSHILVAPVVFIAFCIIFLVI